MSLIKSRADKIHSEYEIPTVHVESEGEKLLKNMIDKQLNKNIRLKDELSRVKHFEQPTELINETEYLSGQNNLTDFKQQAEFLQTLQDLKCSGLTDTEIELYLDNKKGENYLLFKHKNICSSILQEKLVRIHNKLKDKSKTTKSDSISRHVKEIALCTKPNSLETKLFKFAASCTSKSESNVPLNHPINSLPQLETDLFGHLNNLQVPSLKKRRKKAKKYLESDEFKTYSNINESPINNISKWDVKIPNNEYKDVKIYTCVSDRKYTIKNNEIVQINSTGSADPENSQENEKLKGKLFISGNNSKQNVFNKLSLEEIKLLPKFQNYETGAPTKVLFIKNLAKHINEQNLIQIFSEFDNGSNKITYRLLTGKMRGQAFVTFNSIDEATKALESINGIVIKNKPIIIQYGKSA